MGVLAYEGTKTAYDIDVMTATLMTADELSLLPDDGWRYELVRGELRRMSPAGTDHGRIAMRIIMNLGIFLQSHRLGEILPADTGFMIERNPDTVRAPDVSFVSTARIQRTPKFFDGPPDVAFEVISPSDTYTEVDEKTIDYVFAGVRAVVIVDPRRKIASIRRAGGVQIVTDVIAIDDVIPGWKLPLDELFET